MDKSLSVIVPSYNMEKYLPKCLGSLIVDDADLLQRLDVIVVNDGSKDRTSEIAHSFEAKCLGVFRVIDKPNGNYGSCINAALLVAEGRFVKVLDADDSFDTGNFGNFVRYLLTVDDAVDVVLSDFVHVDECDRIIKNITYRVPAGRTFNFDDEDVDQTKFVCMHGVTYRTDLLRAKNYHQTEGVSYTDNEWVFSPMVKAKKFLYYPHVVYRYLMGRAGQTMDAAVRVRSMGMIATVVGSLAKAYGEMEAALNNVRKTYLQKLFLDVARTVYQTGIMNFPSRERDSIIESMENAISHASPCLYELVGNSLMAGPFHYVHIWRKQQRATMLELRVVRLLYAIRCKLRKLGG